MPLRYNTWGRTRSPKNLAGPHGSEVTPYENVSSLAGVTAAAVGGLGYATENQRYLHVLVEDSNEDDGETVTAFGYCHAFLRWFEIPETETGGEGQNTANAASSITVGDSGTAVADQVPSDREYRVYNILGIDRVAFVHEDSGEVNIFAACSTF